LKVKQTKLEKAIEQVNKLGSFIETERKKLRKKRITATTEGIRNDILNPNITNTASITATQKTNTYKTYKSTIQTIYDMYNNTKDYGGEFLRSVIKTRIAFIAGGGVTVIAEKNKVAETINKFLNYNHLLEGSKLFANVKIGELEGKDLMVLKPNKKDEQIAVRNFYSVPDPYWVEMEEKDNQIVKQVVYKSEDENKDQKIAPVKYLIFVRLGGTPDKVNITIPTIGNCLTDIENASRMKYDLRFNNHLYGRLTPTFLTKDNNEAKALSQRLEEDNWEIGKAYCGTSELKIVGPPVGATEAIERELIIACRIISINTGIPIHWLAWPELMSNRATAENLLEVINAATIEEREIWEESLTELVLKAGRIAYNMGFKNWPFNIDNENFEIRLPLISLAALKQIQETWIPLAEMGYISKDSVRNKIPGINPLLEKQLIKKEKQEIVNNITNKFKNDFNHNDEEDRDNEGGEERKEE
jgi:hypothetical protein